MSVINQMMRDLDGRAAQRSDVQAVEAVAAPDGAAPLPAGVPSAISARGYAAARMAGGAVRHGRSLALVCGVAAMLPIAWAAAQYERPAASVPVTHAPLPAGDTATKKAEAPVAPQPGLAADDAPAAVAAAASAAPAAPEPSPQRPVKPLPQVHVAMLSRPKADVPSTLPAAAAPAPPAQPAPPAAQQETRIERQPTDARDDITRAGEAMAVGRVSDAIALLRKVIAAEPENERARLALLSLLAERGRDDAWRAMLADSARAMPARFGLAAAQGMAESGRYEQGLEILLGMPESARDLRYFSALGATQQQLNRHAEAIQAFASALAMAPAGASQTPALLVAQAVSMQLLGKVADARRNLERLRGLADAPADMREFASRELARSR